MTSRESTSPEALEELLHSLNPLERKSALERCLFSEDSGLRALAAKFISRQESPEAFFHIDQMLLGDNLPDKHFALQICILLPFERVRELLMRFFESEEDPGLLQTAAVILAVNPHSEIPSRLFEIGKNASALKRQMLQLIIREIFGTMHKASFHKHLIHNLSSPNPGFRLFTIQQITEFSPTQELQSALDEQLRTETDPECLACLKTAIAKIRKGTNPSSSHKTLLLKPPEKVHPQKPPEPGRPSSERLSNSAQPESPEDYREKLLSLSPEELPPFVSQALTGRPSIRLAILEILIARAPHLLVSHLLNLLNDPEPMIRSLGIRALTVIDPEESVAYLESLVLGKLGPSKQAALQECLFLPFKLVKSLLLKFCAVETTTENLETAEVIFLSNPDWDIPFRLFELLPNSNHEKKTILERTIRGVSESLLKAPSFAEQSCSPAPVEDLKSFLQRLDFWQEKRLTEEEMGRERLLQAIAREFGEEDVEVFLGVSPTPSSPGVSIGIPKNETEFLSFSEERQVRCLAEWPKKSETSPEALLSQLLSSPHESSRVRAMALRTAARMHIPSFVEKARTLVSKGDERIRIAAFEYLIAIDPLSKETLIGEFVGSPYVWLRAKGIEYLQSDDLALSVARLASLFRSKDQRAHHAGLLTLLRFPFSSVRDILTTFLASPPGESYLHPGVLFFEANPDPENLYSLFMIERSHAARGAGGAIEPVRKSRGQLTRLLQETGRLKNTTDYTEKAFETKWQAFEIARKGPSKAYAFSHRTEMQEIASENRFLQKAAILIRTCLIEDPHKRAIVSFGCLMLVAIFLGWRLGYRPPAPSSPPSSAQPSVKNSSNTASVSPEAEKLLHEFSKAAFLDKSLKRGRLALAKGEPKQAEMEYQAALGNAPNNPYIRTFAWGGLCEVARFQKDSKALEIRIKEYSAALGSLPDKAAEPFISHLEELRESLASLSRKGE